MNKWPQPKEGAMRTQPSMPSQTFLASHRTVADAGYGVAVRVSKRTAIWAGGLSTAGGKLPD